MADDADAAMIALDEAGLIAVMADAGSSSETIGVREYFVRHLFDGSLNVELASKVVVVADDVRFVVAAVAAQDQRVYFVECAEAWVRASFGQFVAAVERVAVLEVVGAPQFVAAADWTLEAVARHHEDRDQPGASNSCCSPCCSLKLC